MTSGVAGAQQFNEGSTTTPAPRTKKGTSDNVAEGGPERSTTTLGGEPEMQAVAVKKRRRDRTATAGAEATADRKQDKKKKRNKDGKKEHRRSRHHRDRGDGQEENALSSIKPTGTFATSPSTSRLSALADFSTGPDLSVDGVGSIAMPLKEEDALTLMASSDPAP